MTGRGDVVLVLTDAEAFRLAASIQRAAPLAAAAGLPAQKVRPLYATLTMLTTALNAGRSCCTKAGGTSDDPLRAS